MGDVVLCDAPISGELNWLANRFAETVNTREVQGSGWLEEFSSTATSPVSRIVLFCADRLCFPETQLRGIRSRAPDIPVAVAVSSWWEGSSRTGMPNCSWPIIPWHRWHEAWIPWLNGTQHDLHTQPAQRPLGHLPSEFWRTMSHVGIVGRGSITQAWQELLRSFKVGADGFPPESFARTDASKSCGGFEHLSTLLWDDSCLNTALPLSPEQEQNEVADQIQQLLRSCPNAKIVAAFTMPRWDVWQAAMQAGASEIISKPI